MRICSDLADMIGNTPLIRLRQASEATGCEILGKAEFMNPGQSVKDRAALYIIRDAVARGELRPGGTIVFWSVMEDERFARRMEAAGFDTHILRVSPRTGYRARHMFRRRLGRRRGHHVLFVGTVPHDAPA